VASIASLSVRVGTDISSFTSGLNTAVRQANKAAADIERQFKGLTQIGDKMASVGSKLSLGLSLPLLAIGGAAIKAAASMEVTNVAFTTMLKSGEKAQKFLAELKDFAKATPFEFTELTAASRKMLALGFSAKEVIPTLKTIGDASSALGIGAQGVDRVVLALGQMRLKGKTSAEEMRQLTEAGIDGWGALAKALNTDVAGAMKMVEKRMVDGKATVDIILKEMNSSFGGGMDKQSKTLEGKWSTVMDSLKLAASDVGVTLSKALDVSGKLDSLTKALDAFNQLPQPIKETTVYIGLVVAALPIIVAGVGKWLTAIKEVVKVYTFLSARGVFGFLGSVAIPAAAASAVWNFGKMLLDHAQKPADSTADAIARLNQRMKETGNIKVNFDNFDKLPQAKKSVEGLLDFMKGSSAKSTPTPKPTVAPGLVTGGDKSDPLKDALSMFGVSQQSSIAEMQKALVLVKAQFDAGKMSAGEYTKALEKMAEATWAANNPALALEIATLKIGAAATKELEPLRQAAEALKQKSIAQIAVNTKVYESLPVFQAMRLKLFEIAEAAGKSTVAMKTLTMVKAGVEAMLKPVEKLSSRIKELGITTSAEASAKYEANQKALADAVATNQQLGVEFFTRKDILKLHYETLKAKEASIGLTEVEKKILVEMHKTLETGSKSVIDSIEKQKKPLQEVSTIITNMSQKLADNIVHWKGLKETALGTLQEIGKAILSEIFENLLKSTGVVSKVTKGLNGVLSKIPGLGGIFGKAAGTATKTAADTAGGLSGMLGQTSKVASTAVSSSVTAITSAVTGVISAISGVVGNFQMMAMNKTLDLIEHEVRYSQIHLLNTLNKANEYWPYMKSCWESLIRMETRQMDVGSYAAVGPTGGGGLTIQITGGTFYGVDDIANDIARTMRLRGLI